MKKTVLFFIISFTMGLAANGQILMTTTAKVSFFSETPLQNILAINSSVSSLINTTTDSVLVRIKNTSFAFKNALMQEHFNENYMESTKYPLDSFRGKIDQAIDWKKDGTYKVSATGNITIHGTEKPMTINGTLTVKGSSAHLESEFFARTADFKIEVPKLVFEKIAENIKVNLLADYNLKK